MNESTPTTPTTPTTPRRLAIIGCGSSGLVALKYARDRLPGWEIVCFEKSDRITGCWGNPYPGFVSTSTKYTTQFASYPLFDDQATGNGTSDLSDFFCDGEYGEYLESFADAFGLRAFIRCATNVERIRRDEDSGEWELRIRSTGPNGVVESTEVFQALIVCTGLAARAREPRSAQEPSAKNADAKSKTATLFRDVSGIDQVSDRTVVVIGGGESAVDIVDRLARPERNNRVFLSLRSGIRVSPRYHPIRGVPSDFLRNRLMLSIHPNIRNRIGARFVAARIRYQENFQRWFPDRRSPPAQDDEQRSGPDLKKKEWAMRLTQTAKDDLFDMFHNKSDRFLDAVAEERITIIGPVANSHGGYFEFESDQVRQVEPDIVVPAIGFLSGLPELFEASIRLDDFYLGCCHHDFQNLFLIGFARPIIGNVPTISEMQASLVSKLLAEECSLPTDFAIQHEQDRLRHELRFGCLDLSAVYPVEMIPYCDRLSRITGDYPSLARCGSILSWSRVRVATSTTMHYHLHVPAVATRLAKATVWMPAIFIALLLLLKPLDWGYRWIAKPST